MKKIINLINSIYHRMIDSKIFTKILIIIFMIIGIFSCIYSYEYWFTSKLSSEKIDVIREFKVIENIEVIENNKSLNNPVN